MSEMLSHECHLKSRKIRLFWLGSQPHFHACCPIEFEQADQVQPTPGRGPKQSEHSPEVRGPLGFPSQEAHKQMHQQGHPNLPPNRIGTVAQKVGHLEILLETFEKQLVTHVTRVSP